MDGITYSSTTISDLHSDIILHIFSFIGKKDLFFSVRHTCVLWNQLSRQRLFWKKLDIKDFTDYVFPASLYLNLIAEIQDLVEVLVFNLNHHNLKSVLHGDIVCLNLREIHFELANSKSLGDEIKTAVSTLAVKYPGLQKLSLFSYIPNQPELFSLLTEFTFVGEDCSLMNWLQFLKLHPNLTAITFSKCELPSEVFVHILSQYPDLEKLDISSCTSSFDEVYEGTQSEDVIVHLTKLKHLDISDTDVCDQLLEAIIKYASLLMSLNITNCPRLTNTGIESIAENCPKLKTLVLNVDEFSHADVSFAGVQRIAEKCKYLKVIKLNDCLEVGDAGVHCIVTSCFYLTELEIAGCLSLQDSTVVSLAKNCHHLQKLDVSRCSKLTSNSINTVFSLCKHLKHLAMGSCHRVTDLRLPEFAANDQHDGIIEVDTAIPSVVISTGMLSQHVHIARNINIHHLHITTLVMRFCSMVTNNCMKTIATYCPDLRTLDIQACYLVTNPGINSVLRNCQFLKHLNISGGSVLQTSRINDDCLRDIVMYGHNLEELKIVDNYNITVDGIFSIVKDCCKIHSVAIGIGKRTNVSKESLIDMSRNVKNKTVCLQFKVNAEILIYDDAELSLKDGLDKTVLA